MRVLIALFAVLAVALAFVPQASQQTLKQGWTDLGIAPRNERVELIFALKQQNTDKLHELFMQVSDPKSPKYTDYMTIDEITALVAPAEETSSSVLGFLTHFGLKPHTVTVNKDFFYVSVPVRTAELMLSTEYRLVHHAARNVTLVRAMNDYEIPSAMSRHLDFIIGHTGLPTFHSVKTYSSQENVAVTPSVIRARYNVTGKGSNPNNKQAVAEFQDQFLSPSDLSSFVQRYAPGTTDRVAKVVGTNQDGNPGVEAMLDIEYIMGVGQDIPAWFYSTPNFNFFSDLTSWIESILSDETAPKVHSVSYGDQGEGPAGSYKDRLNTEFQKAGLLGISILFASGDSGTGCISCNRFQPSFPATSPYVTSVGATRFINGQSGEAAVQSFSSGGGFSDYFDRASWQADDVANYFNTATNLPASSYYNKQGRGTPDVAALGIGYEVLVNGGVESVGGTSASTPTFSGIVALLNEHRLASGKKSLGFLNPWLYQTAKASASAFYDVTVGSNPYGCCGTGFPCAQGWDPVTGLGTPNFAELLNHI